MRIAVTGLIGSGKTEIMKAARAMGLACLSADEINAELLNDKSYLARLATLFPSAVKDGRADRTEIARVAFGDGEKLKALNALAHPLILERILNDDRSPLVVETPLFVGTGVESAFDKVIYVKIADDVRRERLTLRGMREEDIAARLAAQREQQALESMADYVIENSSTRQALAAKARETFEQILKTAN